MSEQATVTGRRVTPTAVRVLPFDADRDAWLAARRQGIGASDVPAILGVSDYTTAVHVYHDKRGDLVDAAGEAALWGTLLEAPVADEWKRRQRSVIQRVGLVAHIREPWALTTLDRQVLECPMDRTVRTRCALEVKCRSAFKAYRWHADVPDDVLAQAVWQMYVTGYDHIHVAVLIGGNELKLATVFRDGEIEQYVLGAVRAFRDNHLIPGVEPDWDLSKAERLIEMDTLMHAERTGEIGLPDADAVLEYVQRSKAKSAAEKALKESAATLRRLAGGKELVTFGGELAYRYTTTTRSSCDFERLKEQFPGAYQACVSETKSPRLNVSAAFKKMAEES
jgi:putative phage-type endonuclease